jgi:hypothetical protein
VARIRTIKPEFFRHEALFEAEREVALPLRVAFAGLWTVCDKEGRFIWAPRQLKLDILPYDDLDFARVLDALRTRGFVVKYASLGKEYGYIPSWKAHQVINNRESESRLPEPNESNILERVPDACATRHGLAQGEREKEGEGEGKGTGKGTGSERVAGAPTLPGEGNGLGCTPRIDRAIALVISPKLFDAFWNAYPMREGANPKEPARKAFVAHLKSGMDADAIIAGARGYAEELRRTNKLNTSFVAQAVTWLNQKRWADYQAAAPKPIVVEPDADVAIDPCWAPARARLLADLGAETFASWFRNVSLVALVNGSTIRMAAPTPFLKSRIETNFMDALLRAWRADMPDIERVEIIARSAGSA